MYLANMDLNSFLEMVESENALQESIKRKGDKSYYYAHAPRNVDDPTIATILEGEGIVSGGNPKLLIKDYVKPQEEVKQITNIRNYAWHDDDNKVVISIPYEDSEENVNVTITKDGLEVIHQVSQSEVRKLSIKPLNNPIVPEKSTYRIRRNKLHIHLEKEDTEKTWYGLTKSS